jgi:hypothetical protein
MKIFQIDVQTGEAFERDATELEIQEITETQQNAQKTNAEAADKENLKISAIAKLVDLGLSEDEAKAFLG